MSGNWQVYEEPTVTRFGSFEEITQGVRPIVAAAALGAALVAGQPASPAEAAGICTPGQQVGNTSTGAPVLCGPGGYPDVADATCLNYSLWCHGSLDPKDAPPGVTFGSTFS